jgi:hypothetical protein
MKARPRKNGTKSDSMSRRRFVTMVAAGSAALMAGASGAAPARRSARPAARHAPAAPADSLSARDRAEYTRQQGVTIDTLKVIRGHDMPPGTEMASVFRPIKSKRREG